VLVLGSGGAARAVAMTVALHGRPAELAILGVVEDELLRLGRDITEKSGTIASTQKLDERSLAVAVERAEVLLHCTPVGMTPNVERTVVPSKLLRPDLAIFDAVYNPRRTLLLKEASALGCRVVEGMEMFLGQAMVQFELWTGKPAPAEAMRRVIESRL
jgi:shikimate dehydrogenase